MKSLKAIIVLYGGFGDEREVSIKSGEQVINALKLNHSVEAICLEDRMIPDWIQPCLLYTSPSPRDKRQSRMPSSA